MLVKGSIHTFGRICRLVRLQGKDCFLFPIILFLFFGTLVFVQRTLHTILLVLFNVLFSYLKISLMSQMVGVISVWVRICRVEHWNS